MKETEQPKKPKELKEPEADFTHILLDDIVRRFLGTPPKPKYKISKKPADK